MWRGPILIVLAVTALPACGGETPPPAVPASPPVITTPGPTASTAPTPTPTPPAASTAGTASPPAAAAKPIDADLVGTITGAKPETTNEVIKVSFPRTELPVTVDTFTKMPPFMGLTS